MKNATILLLLLFPTFLFSQIKQIAESELTAGSGIFFAAEKNSTTITITLKGPTDRYFAVGFGTGMSSGDLVMYSNNGVTTDFRDHNMVGYTTPSTDAQQDWTLISNNIVGSQRVIVASRALNTGDANDLLLNFSDNTQTLFWAKSSTASFGIAYHGNGNRGSGIVRNWVLDVTGPALSSTIPLDNTNIPAPNSISATFNENIFAGTGTITLVNDSDQTQATFSVPSANVVISGTTATINTGLLLADKAYHATISAGTFQDASGNNSPAISTSTAWNFNTIGTAAPIILSLSPTDDAIGVPVTSNLILNFGEAVQRGSGTISLFSGSGTLVQSFNAISSPNVTQPTPSQIVINPTANLLPNTNYYINYLSTAISDLTGDALPALSNQTTWNFNTNDGIAPHIINTNPLDNSNVVAGLNMISITFDEPVQLGTGTIQVFDMNSNLFDQIDITPSTNLLSTHFFTLNFGLQPNNAYHFLISTGTFTDGMNDFAGISSDTIWNITTNDVTNPFITILSIPDNSITSESSSVFSIIFNEDINANGSLIQLIGPNSSQNFIVGTNAIENFGTIDFTAVTPLEIGEYYVLIDSTIEDLSGNNFAGIYDTTIWNFTVEDQDGPLLNLSSLIPADNSFLSNITNENFSMSFNEPVQWSTGSIRLKTISGTLVQEYSSTINSTDVTFSGNNVDFIYNFPSGIIELYAIEIDADALTDFVGNPFNGILNSDTWNFAIDWEGIEENLFGQIIYQNNSIIFEQELNYKLISIDGKTLSEGKSEKVNLENLVKGSYILQLENQFSTIVYVH